MKSLFLVSHHFSSSAGCGATLQETKQHGGLQHKHTNHLYIYIYIYIHKQRARARIDTCDCDDRARVSVQGVSLQDVLYLGDDVLSTRALSVGGRVAPLPLQLQPAQLRVRQRQAHASLLPARTIHHPQDRRTSLITMGYSFIKIRSE